MSERSASAASGEEPSPAVNAFLKAIRLYTFHTPIAKGKYRIYQTALRMLNSRPTGVRTTTRDGRDMIVDLTTGMQETVFFIGEYERPITEIASGMIREGDVCVDAGANFGWYTTLMSRLAGASGEVHSFEPVPKTFKELERNRSVAAFPDRIFVNNLALGDHDGTVVINLFDGLPSGHASLSAKGGAADQSFECHMTTLDAYLDKMGVGQVNFVKADIEGAEMMFLKGASRLFEQAVPPVILMEMALAQTREFGYLPNELCEYLRGRGEYSFYEVDEPAGKLIRIDGFAADHIGANVFCIPSAAPEHVHRVAVAYLLEG